MNNTGYTLQDATKTHCAGCKGRMKLLCREDANLNLPWFYICFRCEQVVRVGRGIVPHDQESHSSMTLEEKY